MHAMPDHFELDESFLASAGEMACLLAQFDLQPRRRSTTPQRRVNRPAAPLAKIALALPRKNSLLQETSVAAPPSAIPVKAQSAQPGVERRQYCGCGECKWCRDNARWDRIFAEKFADPSYYGTLRVRYSSSLAGGL
jgi:hypothetical protein